MIALLANWRVIVALILIGLAGGLWARDVTRSHQLMVAIDSARSAEIRAANTLTELQVLRDALERNENAIQELSDKAALLEKQKRRLQKEVNDARGTDADGPLAPFVRDQLNRMRNPAGPNTGSH